MNDKQIKKGSDEYYMNMCLELAVRATGDTSSNPLVGAVIVKDNYIIAKGYHKKAGHDHAEIDAMKNAQTDVSGATLYCNLEPCCHQGKTPPCADAVIKAGIKKVVIGMLDPNPLVSGNSVERQHSAGIQTKVGVLEKECKYLNRIFMYWITKGLPYVIAKVAVSADYKIAAKPGVETSITGKEVQKMVHALRHQFDSILVGVNTIIIDDPELTDRLSEKRNDPIRIILDSTLRLPIHAKVFADKNVIVVATKRADAKKLQIMKDKGIEVVLLPEINKRIDIGALLQYCAEKNITSIFVEGGRSIYESFIKRDVIQEWYICQNSKNLGKQGLDALSDTTILQEYQKKAEARIHLGEDVVSVWRKETINARS